MACGAFPPRLSNRRGGPFRDTCEEHPVTTTSDRPQPVPTTEPPPPPALATIPSEPPIPTGWAALRPLVLRIHFYAGVLVAPFLAVVSLTGLAYVFSPQLNSVLYADELHLGLHTGAPRPLDEQVVAALAAHPDGTLASLVVPADPDRTTGVVLAVPGLAEDVQRTVYIDPYTATVRGALDTWLDTPPAQTTLDGLHRNLLLGEPGRIYSELAASWLWVLVLGGLVLWIGRTVGHRRARRAAALLLPPVSARPGRRRLLGWHGVTGAWLTVALLFISATGLTWSTYAGDRFSAMVTAVHGSSLQLAAEPVPVPVGATAVPLQGVLDTARVAGLAGPLKLTVPDEAGAVFAVEESADNWPVQRDKVAVDPYTGQITETVLWRDFPVMAKLTTIGILAHMGSLFGLVSQLALAALAVGLLTMLVWGYRMWWLRHPTRVDPRPLAGREALRTLSQPVGFAVVVATVAVGWFLPVLGVSLVVFLLADAALGAVSRRRSSKA